GGVERAHRRFAGQLNRDHHGHTQRDGDNRQDGADEIAPQGAHDEGPEQPAEGFHEGSIPAMRPSRSRTRTSAIAAASALCVAMRMAAPKRFALSRSSFST